jgi:hypothetical protein
MLLKMIWERESRAETEGSSYTYLLEFINENSEKKITLGSPRQTTDPELRL